MPSGMLAISPVALLMSSRVMVSRLGKEFGSVEVGVAGGVEATAAGCDCAVDAYRNAAIDGTVAGIDLAQGVDVRANEEVLCDTLRR